jgi:hypothetical protein
VVNSKVFLTVAGLLATAVGLPAGPLELEPKQIAPAPAITNNDHWYFNIGMPGWIAFISGDIGLECGRGLWSNHLPRRWDR